MNELTKALLNDLQDDLDRIKRKPSNIEVIWELEKMQEAIKMTNNLIRKSLKTQ